MVFLHKSPTIKNTNLTLTFQESTQEQSLKINTIKSQQSINFTR